MKTRVEIFGVYFSSDIELAFTSKVAPVEFEADDDDVVITASETPSYLDNSTFYGNAEFCGAKGLLNFGKRGRVLVEDGKRVRVTAGKSSTASQVLKENFPSILAIVFFQRDKLLLHASCMERNGSAVAFMGDSGTGKSTLANALLQKGFKLITDDILVPCITENRVVVHSGPSQLRLFSQGLQDESKTTLERETIHSTKKLISVPQHRLGNKAKLRAIVNLNWKISDNNQPEINPVQGFEAFEKLQKNIYRPEFVTKLEMDEILFQQTAKLIGKVEVYDLYRSHSLSALSKSTDAILSMIE